MTTAPLAGDGAELQTLLAQLSTIEATDDHAPMLPRECYTSAAFFEFEREAVFARSWLCVGRTEQIPQTGDYLAARVAGEPLLIVRGQDAALAAMSAVCQHRGQVIAETSGSVRHFRCPLHFWTYDLDGKLLGAPRMGDRAALECLRRDVRLRAIRLEVWHGFIFVNLDEHARPLAPTLAKLESLWQGYDEDAMVAVPPVPADNVLPWNWKLHLENFTDAYHPEFVHVSTHDFAPSVHADGGVAFTDMAADDNAIVRSVPLLKSDGGMMRDGWGEAAAFPPIETLTSAQRNRITFAMLPPGMTLVFAPNAIAYQLITPVAVASTLAANDRVTGGGWLIPRTTRALPDFDARAAQVREGGAKIWAQDVPVNLAMQAGKQSRFMPPGRYGPLEVTLTQFNAWLLNRYREGMSEPSSAGAAHLLRRVGAHA